MNTLRYICKRLLLVIPLLIVISVLAFLLSNLSSGDVASVAIRNEGGIVNDVTLAAKREELGLEGLALRGGGKMLAFTMGKSLGGDTYDVFFEKAYGDVQGAYPMINREFARWVREHHPEIVYLNREERELVGRVNTWLKDHPENRTA